MFDLHKGVMGNNKLGSIYKSRSLDIDTWRKLQPRWLIYGKEWAFTGK